MSINNLRPSFHLSIPNHWKKLIKSCWSRNPNERPSFDEIISAFKSNPKFIKDIDQDEFIDYTTKIGDTFPYKKKIKIKKKNLKKKINLQSNEKDNENIKEKVIENKVETFNSINKQINNNDFIDLNNYEHKELIKKSEFYKVFKVVDKANNQNIFAARISNIK